VSEGFIHELGFDELARGGGAGFSEHSAEKAGNGVNDLQVVKVSGDSDPPTIDTNALPSLELIAPIAAST
jgi:hypothetical protein